MIKTISIVCSNLILLSVILSLAACSDSNPSTEITSTGEDNTQILEAIEDYVSYVRSSTPRNYYVYTVPKNEIVIPTLNGMIFNPIIEAADVTNVHLLYQYLYDPHPLIRQMAVAVIGQIEPDQTISRVMLASLLDPHPAVRMYSIYIIAYQFEGTPYENAIDSWDVAFRIACRDPYELHQELADWLYKNRRDLYPSKMQSYDIGDVGRRIGDGGS